MALNSAFIKLNSRFFVFHRFKERQGLAFAHLSLFFRFGFGNLRVLIERLLRFVFSSRTFHIAGKFFLRGSRWTCRWCRVFILTFSRRGRRRFIFSFARAW